MLCSLYVYWYSEGLNGTEIIASVDKYKRQRLAIFCQKSRCQYNLFIHVMPIHKTIHNEVWKKVNKEEYNIELRIFAVWHLRYGGWPLLNGCPAREVRRPREVWFQPKFGKLHPWYGTLSLFLPQTSVSVNSESIVECATQSFVALLMFYLMWLINCL